MNEVAGQSFWRLSQEKHGADTELMNSETMSFIVRKRNSRGFAIGTIFLPMKFARLGRT
jgi:hypothetical protein